MFTTHSRPLITTKQRKVIERDTSTPELFEITPKTCIKCNSAPVYLGLKSMNWCEPCMWIFVQDRQVEMDSITTAIDDVEAADLESRISALEQG